MHRHNVNGEQSVDQPDRFTLGSCGFVEKPGKDIILRYTLNWSVILIVSKATTYWNTLPLAPMLFQHAEPLIDKGVKKLLSLASLLSTWSEVLGDKATRGILSVGCFRVVRNVLTPS